MLRGIWSDMCFGWGAIRRIEIIAIDRVKEKAWISDTTIRFEGSTEQPESVNREKTRNLCPDNQLLFMFIHSLFRVPNLTDSDRERIKQMISYLVYNLGLFPTGPHCHFLVQLFDVTCGTGFFRADLFWSWLISALSRRRLFEPSYKLIEFYLLIIGCWCVCGLSELWRIWTYIWSLLDLMQDNSLTL